MLSVVGLRPGEKRHEDLVYPFERTQNTPIAGVWLVDGPETDPATVRAMLDVLLAAASDRDVDALKTALTEICHIDPAGLS